MLRRSLAVLALLAAAQLANAQRRRARSRRRCRKRAAHSSAWPRRAQTKKIIDRYDPTFRKYTKRYFGPAFDWRYFKAQGFAESGLKADGDELGRRARHHAAHAVDLSGDRVAPSGVRPDRSARVEHRRRHHARSLSVGSVAQGHRPDDERHHFMFASYNAGEGTITRALAAAKNKGGTPEWSSVELIAPTVQRWRYSETLGYVRRIDSTYAS